MEMGVSIIWNEIIINLQIWNIRYILWQAYTNY